MASFLATSFTIQIFRAAGGIRQRTKVRRDTLSLKSEDEVEQTDQHQVECSHDWKSDLDNAER